jgi:hypothetical protein
LLQRLLARLQVVSQWESSWQVSPPAPAVQTRGVSTGQCPRAQSAFSAQSWPTAPELQVPSSTVGS